MVHVAKGGDVRFSLGIRPKRIFNKTTFHSIYSAIYKPFLIVCFPPTFLISDSTFSLLPKSLPVYVCVCVPLSCHALLLLCLSVLFPCGWQMYVSFGLCKYAVSLSPHCHSRWWPGWCNVNDWRPWSPHTSCCSSCAPCWFWALFSTPPGSYIYMYGARSLVSDLFNSTVCDNYSSLDYPSVRAQSGFESCMHLNSFIEQICLTPVSVFCLPVCAECQSTVRLFQYVFCYNAEPLC